jgi:hypothetical protein
VFQCVKPDGERVGVVDPGKILDKPRELVLETFAKSESEVKDGMDISLAVFNHETAALFWAGANNPLWYVHEGQLLEIEAIKQPIGKSVVSTPFTTHRIQLCKDDRVYLFTEGLPDQFGGPKGKNTCTSSSKNSCFRPAPCLWKCRIKNYRNPFIPGKAIWTRWMMFALSD